MASEVDICNMALSLVGSATTVTSIRPPDGSAAAGHCRTFYDIARQELLDCAPWSWSKVRVGLTPANNPSTVWRYAYALPSDCMSPLRILPLAALVGYGFPGYLAPVYPPEVERTVWSERGSADWEQETLGGEPIILTNEPDAVLLYTVDNTNPTRWSPGFVAALSTLLAAYLAGPILRGNAGAKLNLTYRAAVLDPGGMADRVFARDAAGSSETADFVPSGIQARA